MFHIYFPNVCNFFFQCYENYGLVIFLFILKVLWEFNYNYLKSKHFLSYILIIFLFLLFFLISSIPFFTLSLTLLFATFSSTMFSLHWFLPSFFDSLSFLYSTFSSYSPHLITKTLSSDLCFTNLSQTYVFIWVWCKVKSNDSVCPLYYFLLMFSLQEILVEEIRKTNPKWQGLGEISYKLNIIPHKRFLPELYKNIKHVITRAEMKLKLVSTFAAHLVFFLFALF